MSRERLDKYCERGILGLVLAILIFAPLAFGAVRVLEFVVLQNLTALVVLLWIVRLWIHPQPVFFWPPICWAALAFLIYALIRHRLAPIEYVARLELIKVVTYAFLFFAVINNLSRQESTQIVGVTLIALAFALSAFSVFQFITHYPRVWNMMKPEGYSVRGSGTFINPNHFAGFLEMILPLSLAYTLIGRFNHLGKVIFGYASLVLVVGIGATLSRGGWVATALTLVVLLAVLLLQRDFRLRSLLVLSILLALGLALVFKADKSQQRFDQLKSAAALKDQRIEYWAVAKNIWREDIWLGAGPGHYDYRFRQYRPPDLQGLPQFAHNDYLNTLADWGLTGLGLIVIFLLLFGAGVLKTWRFVQRSPNDLGTKSSNKAAFVLGGSLGVLALAFHSFVDFNLHIPANAILALTLVALVSTYLRFATESFWAKAGWLVKISLTIIGGAAIFYLGQQGLRQGRENFFLTRAAAETQSSERRLAWLKKAAAVEPDNFETADLIGEIFRAQSFLGQRGYETQTRGALSWFERSIKLNPFYPFSHLHYGMGLDWLGQHEEAENYFARARMLDPNGYFTAAYLGWHRLQLEDYDGAKKEFTRSENLFPNPMAESYLEIIEERLAEPNKN